MKKESRKEILLRIKSNLESIFTGVNDVSPDLSVKVMGSIKDLESVTGSVATDHAIHNRSQNFANDHKDFCVEISKKFEEKGLQYFIHIADQLGNNTISYGKMDEPVMIKSIAGAMIMSKMIFQGVVRELGMNENCVECITNVPPEIKEGYSADGLFKDGEIPQRLKHMLEEKLGGKLVEMGTIQKYDDLFQPSIKMIIDAINNHSEPDALLKVIAGLGPKKVIDQLLRSLGVTDDFVFSKNIPNLGSFSIERLEMFEKQLINKNDSMSKYLLSVLQEHMARRRKEETKDESGVDVRKD